MGGISSLPPTIPVQELSPSSVPDHPRYRPLVCVFYFCGNFGEIAYCHDINFFSHRIVFVVAPVIGLGTLVSARSGCELSPHTCSPFRPIANYAFLRYSVAPVPQHGYLSRSSSSTSPRVKDPPAVYGIAMKSATRRSSCAAARAVSGLRSCALCIIFSFSRWILWTMLGRSIHPYLVAPWSMCAGIVGLFGSSVS